MSKQQCQCMTKKGTQCANKPLPGSKYCNIHKNCTQPITGKIEPKIISPAKTKIPLKKQTEEKITSTQTSQETNDFVKNNPWINVLMEVSSGVKKHKFKTYDKIPYAYDSIAGEDNNEFADDVRNYIKLVSPLLEQVAEGNEVLTGSKSESIGLLDVMEGAHYYPEIAIRSGKSQVINNGIVLTVYAQILEQIQQANKELFRLTWSFDNQTVAFKGTNSFLVIKMMDINIPEDDEESSD